MVPGHICYGPAHWPDPIVLPPAPMCARCPRPQRGLLMADLYGQASRGLRAAPPQLADVLKAGDPLTFAQSCCHFESHRPEACIPLQIYFPPNPTPLLHSVLPPLAVVVDIWIRLECLEELGPGLKGLQVPGEVPGLFCCGEVCACP